MQGWLLTPEMIRLYTQRGLWGHLRLHDYLDRHAKERPDFPAVVSPSRGQPTPVRLTWSQLRAEVDRAAWALRALGVGKGDVVSVQLPNWYEFVVTALAVSKVGGVLNGLTHIYRQYELRFILNRTGSRVMVIPATYRNFDYAQMLAGLRPETPALEHVVVVGTAAPAGMITFDDFLARGEAAAGQDPALPCDANDLVQVAFTSGTTGEPKGVMHSHNTLLATAAAIIQHMGLVPEQANLVISPVGHQTGFLWGLLITIMLGGKMVFQDRWDPEQAIESIAREGITTIAGATPFLRDLTYAANLTPEKIRSLRSFITAGAPIPPVVVQDGEARLGCKIHSAWGMTEYGIGTAIGHSDPQAKAAASDGRPVPGAEVRVVGAEGRPTGAGVEGDLQIRGPGLFLGYYKRPDFNEASFTADGFLKTGDRAIVDADGFIRITGRTKDVIIRGGENIPVAEIEGLLYRHPKIQDVALVAMPDERLGERACACVVLKPGVAGIELAEIAEFLLGHQLARQYLPERVEVIPELPRTATGKVQKFKLREEVARK